MDLRYIIIYTQDVLATVNFYKKAFGLAQRFVDESNKYAEMETGQTVLAFVSEDIVEKSIHRNRLNQDPPGIEICFVTSHVHKQFDRAVKAGAISVAPPEQKPWGQIVSYVKDNNGCLIEICSAIKNI